MKRKLEDEEEDQEQEDEEENDNHIEDEYQDEQTEENEKEPTENEKIELKVLGNDVMNKLESIKITSSWVANATQFSAKIDSETTEELNSIALPDFLKQNIPENIKSWFPVQHSVLPTLLKQVKSSPSLRPRDIAIAAPTGSGKTLCYVLPILAAIGPKPSKQLHALIVVPVQTLASQIVEEFKRWDPNNNAKIVCLSGSNEFEKEVNQLKDYPNIIVATPARLSQHLTSSIPCPINLKQVRFIVTDEADRMGRLLREEWLEHVEFLCGGMARVAGVRDVLRQRRAPQKIILSATLSKDVEELHLWNLFQPRLFSASAKSSEEVNISHVSGTLALPTAIKHDILICEAKYHPLVVYKQILEHQFNRIIVFVNEVSSSNRLAHVLKQMCQGEYEVEYFTANLFGKRRFKMLKRFNDNPKRILICSDVLARGTDLKDIDCVVNYNLPNNDKLFVHRAGRTGRAGKSGYLLSIGDKETKRIFIKMLKATKLYNENVRELSIDESNFEDSLDRYTKAIESLKETVQGAKDVKPTKRSGFEARKRSRPTASGERPWLKKKDKDN